MRFFFSAGAVLTAVFLCASFSGGGCAAKYPEVKTAEPRVSDKVMVQRAEELKKALADFPFRGIELAPEWLPSEEQFSNRQILKKIQAFGFNCICIYLKNKDFLGEKRLTEFVTEARREGFRVMLELRQSDFVYHYRGNALVRMFVPESLSVVEMAREVASFNEDLPEDAKLNGLIIAVDPHEFTRSNHMRPKNYVFSWDEKSYGAGLDNDLMMRHALNMLLEVCNAVRPLPVTASVADFYHDRAKEGKLTVGKMDDFLEISPQVIVRSSGNKPSEAVLALGEELQDMKRHESVVIGFSLASHASISKGAFRKRNWTDFMKGVNYLVKTWSRSPAMGGMMLGPLRVLDELQREE